MFLLKSILNSIFLILSIVISKLLLRFFGRYVDSTGLTLWITIIVIFFILSMIFEWAISNHNKEYK